MGTTGDAAKPQLPYQRLTQKYRCKFDCVCTTIRGNDHKKTAKIFIESVAENFIVSGGCLQMQCASRDYDLFRPSESIPSQSSSSLWRCSIKRVQGAPAGRIP